MPDENLPARAHLRPENAKKRPFSQSVTNRHQMRLATRTFARMGWKTHPWHPVDFVDFVDFADFADIFMKASICAGLRDRGLADILWISRGFRGFIRGNGLIQQTKRRPKTAL